MKVYNAIIIDDERNIREGLAMLVAEYCPGIRICGTAPSAGKGRELLKKNQVDFIFLDVSMPQEDGFDFLKSIPVEQYGIIFVTAYEEYAMSALKANAIDYLLKPVNPIELQQAVSKAVKRHQDRKVKADIRIIPPQSKEELVEQINIDSDPRDKITVEDQFGYKMVKAADLMYLETDSSYTILHFSGLEKVVSTRSLMEFEQLLEGQYFFRIHKSYLINLNYVKTISSSEGNFAELSDGTRLSISRRKAAEFREALKEFINR